MKDKDRERDRRGDGAGPVAALSSRLSAAHRGFTSNRAATAACLMLVFAFIPSHSFSQTARTSTLRGLSLLVDVGVMRPSNQQADFYNGNPANVNTLDRILHSESFGHQIWNNLTEQDLIGSAVSSYQQITVAEYGHMNYKLAFQLGLGFRYDIENPRWAWQVRFDYAKLHAQGLVLLNSGKNQSILSNQNAYVNCPASGLEERIYFNVGIIRKFKTQRGYDIEASLGANVNNTKVESSDIRIAGVTYSILDIWGGQYPSMSTMPYEYINQGGIGYGGYASLSAGFTLPTGTAVQVAYTMHYNKVNLQRYTSFAPHHAVSLTVFMNNFKLFDD